jgi:hypothetical protein
MLSCNRDDWVLARLFDDFLYINGSSYVQAAVADKHADALHD